MKLLLDHNIPAQLKGLLSGHFASTAREMGWDRLRNGDLLAAAQAAGFDAMLTADQSIYYQQNNRLRRLSLIVVDTNHRPTPEWNVAVIIAAVERSSIGSFEEVLVRRGRSRSQPR